MKHIALIFAALVALLACLAMGASFFLKSTVEDMAKEAIMSMAGPGESALEEVTFSPLTRELAITGWRSRHQTAEGPVSTHAPSVHGKVTFRGIFACMPVIGDLLNNADTNVPVLTNLQGKDIVWTSSERRVNVPELQMDVVSMRYGLLQQYTLGLRPPFAQAVTGVQVNRLTARDVTVDVFGPNITLGVKAGRLEASGINGTCAKEILLASIQWTEPGLVITGRQVRFEDIKISPALFSELVAASSRRPRSVRARDHLVEALVANGPLVGRTSMQDIVQQEGFAPFSMESCDLVWTDETPLNVEAHVRALKLSPQIANLSGMRLFSVEGMNEIHVDADLVSSGMNPSRQTGLVRFKDLGELKYEFSLARESGAISDMVITWRDFGLTARMGRIISPDPHAASMVLKASMGSLCQNDSEGDKAACRRLADFVDAPGILVLRSNKGYSSSMDLLLPLLSGRLGSAFTVEVTQGPATLTQQSEALFR